MDNHFTHVDAAGNARMVDVGEKAVTHRTAVAVGRVTMSPECFAAVAEGRAKKGDVLGVAQVAGIMATKRTSSCSALPREIYCFVLFPSSWELKFMDSER